MPQWLWKAAQSAVFFTLTFGFYEVTERQISMLAAMVVALAFTWALFMPFLYLQDWLLRRRSRGGQFGNGTGAG